jgi:elongation factor P
MASTTEIKRGMRIELDGEPYLVVELNTQSPSARGAATLIKTKLRNLKTKQMRSETFKSGDRVKLPDFEIRPCQYLYDEGGETYYFMDMESYEQHPVPREMIEYELGFLLPNAEVRAVFFDEQCIGIEVPATVELRVVECEPGVRGDTATHTTKAATLETGLEVQVPLFVEEGTVLVIDTREARYVRRA